MAALEPATTVRGVARERPATPSPALPHGFYDRPVVDVARDLLGCVLVHGATGGRIVETEAYHETEPACHGYGTPPRPTRRTAVLFGPAGMAYVYRSYGIHSLFNAVCEAEGTAAAVLIRAIEPLDGLDLIRKRRPGRPDRELASGPGRLTLALDIELEHDGGDLVTGPVRILPADPGARPVQELVGLRIGITKAADLPWRFVDASSPDVSRPWPPEMRGGRKRR